MKSLKDHLNKIRAKSHATQRKNGHYSKMGKASKLARLKLKKAKQT